MQGAILGLGTYDYGLFWSWCAGGDMVVIRKSGAILKACNGEPSPLFVALRGTGNFFSHATSISSRLISPAPTPGSRPPAPGSPAHAGVDQPPARPAAPPSLLSAFQAASSLPLPRAGPRRSTQRLTQWLDSGPTTPGQVRRRSTPFDDLWEIDTILPQQKPAMT